MVEVQSAVTGAFIAPSQPSCFLAKNSDSPRSGDIGGNLLHFDARKSTQRLRPDIAQHVRGQLVLTKNDTRDSKALGKSKVASRKLAAATGL